MNHPVLTCLIFQRSNDTSIWISLPGDFFAVTVKLSYVRSAIKQQVSYPIMYLYGRSTNPMYMKKNDLAVRICNKIIMLYKRVRMRLIQIYSLLLLLSTYKWNMKYSCEHFIHTVYLTSVLSIKLIYQFIFWKFPENELVNEFYWKYTS